MPKGVRQRVTVTKAELMEQVQVLHQQLAALEHRQAARDPAQDVIQNIAQGISAETGDAFFRSMVYHLGRTLEVAYAFVGEVSPGKADHVSTVAVYCKGTIVENFEYGLANTPCAHVVGQQLCAHPSGVQKQFPLDTLLADMGVESYMGCPLNDSAGQPHGILVVLDTKPLSHPERMEAVFRIFATRAAAELERKRAEEALQASEARYHGILHIAHEGIVSIDGTHRMVVFNQGASRMFGYVPEEVLGQPLDILLPEWARTAHARQITEFAESTEHARGMGARREICGRRQNGEEFPAEASISKLEVAGGHIFTIVLRDITERKRLEDRLHQSMEKLEEMVAARTARIQELETQRMQVEKLAALGQLAAGVAHEINNPLAGVKNAFLVIEALIPEQHHDYQYVRMIKREIDRMSEIVRQMYQLYRPESAQKLPLDLATTLQEVVSMLAGTCKQHGLTVTTEVAQGLPPVTLPEGQLIQVLLNLFQNAIDASPEGGRIMGTVVQDDGAVRIGVADQGPGIPSEVLPHLFEPFFSTKPQGKQGGMGLGLAVSRSLVEAMGGRIEIETKVGQGSTFIVVVPVGEAANKALVGDKPHGDT